MRLKKSSKKQKVNKTLKNVFGEFEYFGGFDVTNKIWKQCSWNEWTSDFKSWPASWSSAKNRGPKCIKEINIIFTFRKIKPYFEIELLNHMVFKRQISIGTPKSKNKWCDHAHDRAIGPRSGKNFQFLWPNRDTTAIKSKISLSRVILRFENESIYYLWESIFFPVQIN
jgi:hypothetical protein